MPFQSSFPSQSGAQNACNLKNSQDSRTKEE
jgi:hypothetical protein